jgi:hypothetical protein
MIYQIKNDKIQPFKSDWLPKELDLEKFILPSNSDEPILQSSVFGEQLFLIRNQPKTKQNKRGDILALDRLGNGVIIELKRKIGWLGVEMQALQYLAEFSTYKGKHFLTHFSKADSIIKEDDVLGFLGGNFRVEDINRSSRIILMARAFDPSLFSMGEWLSNSGVAFRCIEYTPFEVSNNDRFITFSVAFDRAPTQLYPLMFENRLRWPGFFWHNIGCAKDDWWTYLFEHGIITANFDNQPGDQGERLLRGYVSGDTIIAYSKGVGAIGWGVIKDSKSYRLVKEGDEEDVLKSRHLHRIGVDWRAVAPKREDGLRPDYVRKQFGIYHPVATSASIPEEKAKHLIAALSNKFPKK